MSTKKEQKDRKITAKSVATQPSALRKDGLGSISGVLEEDKFTGLYSNVTVAPNGNAVTVYPVLMEPLKLAALVAENNTLGPCISAYEVNIDGTGWDIEFAGDDEEEEVPRPPTPEEIAVRDHIRGLLNEPWPGKSFIDIRKEMRRFKESVGMGLIEVVKNAEREPVLLRAADSTQFRIVRPTNDDLIKQVMRKVRRNNEEFEVTMPITQRRFRQKVNGREKDLYYAEFGCPLDLNRYTGEWSDEPLPADLRANELLVFETDLNPVSPYPFPRWIGQLPSVLGSREAEELNLEYFGNGGVPPFLAFIHGGSLVPEAKTALDSLLSGHAKNKVRGLVLELMSTDGSFDDKSAVKLSFERFGGEQTQDSLFENYDARCELRVRRSFRLPPIFVGAAQDYSFASAYASYVVAEAQVFAPERMVFDEVFNNTVMRALDPSGVWLLRSKPLSVKDINLQMQALGLQSEFLTVEDYFKALNDITLLENKPAPPGKSVTEARAKMQAASAPPPGPPMPGAGVPGTPTDPATAPADGLPGTKLPSPEFAASAPGERLGQPVGPPPASGAGQAAAATPQNPYDRLRHAVAAVSGLTGVPGARKTITKAQRSHQLATLAMQTARAINGQTTPGLGTAERLVGVFSAVTALSKAEQEEFLSGMAHHLQPSARQTARELVELAGCAAEMLRTGS